MTSLAPHIRKLSCEIGPQIGQTARLGLIALQTDERIEADLRAALPVGEDQTAFVTRVPSGAEVTLDSLQSMSTELTRAANLLPPSVTFDVIGYGCTSASSVIGSEAVEDLVKAGRSTAHVTNPLRALIAGCRHLNITRLAVLTPYLADVTQSLIDALSNAGISCTAVGAFEESTEARVARITSDSLAIAAANLDPGQTSQAVFLSCTNLNTFGLIDALEARLSVPVLSSNQALFWHMGQLSGASLNGPGKLFA